MDALVGQIDSAHQELGAAQKDSKGHYTDEWFEEKNERVGELEVNLKLVMEKQVQQCMLERKDQLKQLKAKETIRVYAVRDNFEWREMLFENGMCVDPSQCLCDVLLAPNKVYDAAFLQARVLIEKATRDKEL